MKNLKSQSAVEFFILIGVLFFIFLIFLYLFQSDLASKADKRKDEMIRETALSIQNELSLASESSDGYLRTFEIPRTILGSNYEANITSGFIYVRTSDGSHAISLPVQNVTGDLNITTNKIRKVEGAVYLNVP